MRRYLLFSGGIDSYILWHLLDFPLPVYVQLGHKYQYRELEAMGRMGIYPEVINGPQIGHLEANDGHIPHRNLLLVSTVAAALQPDTIYIGALKGETSRDKSWRFVRKTQNLLSWLERPVEVKAPAKRLTKTQLVRQFLDRYADGEMFLRQTISCYADAGDLPCGECQSCFRRWVAMSLNGIAEPYAAPPWDGVDVDLGYMWRTPVSEWPAVLHNNLDAYRALRRVR